MPTGEPWAAWNLVYNEDRTFRGYEWAISDEGDLLTRPRPAAIRSGVERGDPFAFLAHPPVSLSVDPGKRVSGPHLRPLAARADHPVADDPDGAHLQLGTVEGEADGQDTDAMEHERQRRLAKWQRLPE